MHVIAKKTARVLLSTILVFSLSLGWSLMTWANEGILGVTEGFNDPSQLPPEVPDIAETESLDGIAGLSAELDGTAPNPDGAAPESIAAAGAIGASLEQPSSPIMALDGPVSPAAQTYNGTIRIVDGFAVEPTDYNWNSIAWPSTRWKTATGC